ncbi:hypothetical protein ACAG26_08250 [Mycobacterium sp. pUA109]|uniref:hypothetical protein n=1 Tax=Mycobacterium sp. pUA109 TaxID=3238982 RepID=UPI00351AC8F3
MDGADGERERALRRLPAAYATALRLRTDGATDAVIVERLDIEPEALDPFMRIAEAKLAALMSQQLSC